MARPALEKGVRGEPVPEFEITDSELMEPRACFVTLKLKKSGQLRGCMGSFDPEGPLFGEVTRLVLAAALEDPRFPPVQPGELDEIQIEISVLRPPERIRSAQEIELGRHGIIVQQGRRHGAFLPEVAKEMGWGAEEFVRQCALEKAGLPEPALAEAELYRFETEKIREGEIQEI